MSSKELMTAAPKGRGLTGRIIFPLVYIILAVVLLIVPTGFQKAIYYNAEGAVAEVLETDNSALYNTGYFREGEQSLMIRIASGSHRGYEGEAINMLSGTLSSDKLFSPGDKAWILVERNDEDEPIFINAVDHWRGGREVVVIVAFMLALLLFSSAKGSGIVFSFAFAFLFLWKVLIPLSLKGYNPILIAFFSLTVLTLTTITLVLGRNRKALSAVLGALASDMLVSVLSIAATSFLLIDGFHLEGSESLLYSGFGVLDFKSLFSAIVMLSSGGAVMDLSVDVVSAMGEVLEQNPRISRKDLVASGIRVGRAGIGTQTSTLLLAYLSSYLVPFMVYMAQGTPLMNIAVSKEIASAICETTVGCTGLVAVAPLSAVISSFLLRRTSDR
ncbi:MAG: YibE/F family protein [Candidatus Ornithospirochaeta sp.]